jgi:hypothetical protein
MSVKNLDFAEPFFSVRYLVDETAYAIGKKSIVVNLSEKPIRIFKQALGFFQSAVTVAVAIEDLARCLVVEDFERNTDLAALYDQVKKTWVLAFDATGEERHRDVALWRSPKINLGNIAVNMCYAGTVPLNVGLHRLHWGGETFKEVHTQITGYGKMQQYREKDLSTLYLEDPLSPGATHRPMYDEDGNYPWHQYETVTQAIFMPIEMQLSDELGV